MANVWRRRPHQFVHPKAVGKVLITSIAELPVGVSVSVYMFGPGSQLNIGASFDSAAWTALSGSGWVDSEESGREELEPGWTAFVGVGDTPTFGSDAGMVLVQVFGGSMMPEVAAESSKS